MENTVNKYPRERYSLHAEWQLCDSTGPVAPMRPFQWDAINDLPDAVFASFDDDAYYLMRPFRLVKRDA